jgi:DNA-binding CsgD family transcriptional regulator
MNPLKDTEASPERLDPFGLKDYFARYTGSEGRMPAVDVEKLRLAAARLGDAAIDPAVWPDIMHELSVAVGAEGAALLQSDVRTSDVPISPAVVDLLQNYFRNGWHKRDLRAERGVPLLMQRAKVIIDQDLITPDEMRGAGFYNENLLPSGFQWFACVGFFAGSALWGLSIQRTPRQGPFGAEDKHVLALLSDKLTEVATLSTAVGRAALLNVVNALNLIPQPAVAIDCNGFVLETNKAAETVFDRDLRVAWRRLVLADAEAKRTFETFLDRLRLVPDRAVLSAEPIVVRRPNRAPIVIKILPIDGAARGPFLGARALLLLTELGPKSAPKEHLVAKAYGLSPAEARLAARIATGSSLEDVADELGLALSTARNQLKSVFAKTDTHRQGELVALLSKL